MSTAVEEGGGSDRLFGHLPPSLFGVLGSPARRAYARLILAIWRRYFSEGYADVHRRDEVIAFIGSEIERSAGYEDLAVDAHNSSLSQNPGSVYGRLVDGGWLVEHRQGYVAVVDLDPSVSMLVETLAAIEEGEAVHFGGTIAAIESVVEKLGDAPVEKASSLADSAQRARRFQQHLAAVVGGLRGYEKLILSKPDPAHILARFFDDFVENMLIADYRALKTRNNPFRHRDRIIALISGYENDDERLADFAEGYSRQGLARSLDDAAIKVRQHLHQVKMVFLRAEERLDEIDAFRIRLERRIARTISYMNQVDSSLPARVAGLVQRLSARMSGWEKTVPVPSDLTDPVRIWGPENLATVRTRRRATAAIPLRVEENDPILTEYDRLKRAYFARLVMTPEKIGAFLEARMAGRNAIEASEILVEDVEQALIFQRLRMLDFVGDARLVREYRVVVRPGELIETDWSVCPNFMIERRGSVREAHLDAV